MKLNELFSELDIILLNVNESIIEDIIYNISTKIKKATLYKYYI